MAEADNASLKLGDSYERVLTELGRPQGTIMVGQRQILSYPGGSLEITGGRLSKMAPDFMSKTRERKIQADFEVEQKKKGLTVHEGRWIPLSEKELIEAERRQRWLSTHIGTLNYTIHTKLFGQSSEYFSGPMRSKAYRHELADKTNRLTPEACVGYAPGTQTAFVYVPADYDGNRPFGLCVDIRPYANGAIPPGYKALADKHHFIWISPNQAGNNVESFRRWALALDALATIKKDYRIDERRVFLNGFSGGGITGISILMLYPDFFKGVISHARGANLMDRPDPDSDDRMWPSHFSYLDSQDLQQVASMGKKWIFISGPQDFNYIHIRAAQPQWKALNFKFKFIDVPDMGHRDAHPRDFESALNWLDVDN